MSILKLQILNNDRYRLIIAGALSLFASIPLLIELTFRYPQTQHLPIVFNNSKNSLYQNDALESVGIAALKAKAAPLNTPELLTNKTSKVQLYIRESKTKLTDKPAPKESKDKSKPIISNLASKPVSAYSHKVGAQIKKLLLEDLLFSIPPYYPVKAREEGLEGIATLRLVVRSSGFLLRIQVLKSSAHPILDAEAIKAARNWQFKPDKTLTGNREYIVNIEFKLDETQT